MVMKFTFKNANPMTTQEFISLLKSGRIDFEKLPDNLIEFNDELVLRDIEITSLGRLKKVFGVVDFQNIPLTSLGNLEYVDGYLYLSNTSIISLGNLEYVDGSLFLQRTQIESLNNLKYVGQSLYLSNTPLAKNHTIEELEEMYPQFKGKFII